LSEVTATSPDHNQATPQARQRDAFGRWVKGVSGNPNRHQQWLERERQRKELERQYLDAIVAEAGGELPVVDMALAKVAATQLARAQFITKPDMMVRLTRSAAQLVDRIRAGTKVRKPPVTAFDAYALQQGGDS